MQKAIDITILSKKEKFQLMEALWEDLIKDSDSMESPEWHGKVLEEREKSLQSGEERFVEWSEAKEKIRKSIK